MQRSVLYLFVELRLRVYSPVKTSSGKSRSKMLILVVDLGS
jgi:hypothetical protein